MDSNSNVSYPECISSLKPPIMEQQNSAKGPKLGLGSYRHTKLCTLCALRARHFHKNTMQKQHKRSKLQPGHDKMGPYCTIMIFNKHLEQQIMRHKQLLPRVPNLYSRRRMRHVRGFLWATVSRDIIIHYRLLWSLQYRYRYPHIHNGPRYQ